LTSDGAADGSCGTFGGYTQVGTDDPATPYVEVVPTDGTCYRYEYVVPDQATLPPEGGVESALSVKVDARCRRLLRRAAGRARHYRQARRSR
jgi:hypothetical protein